MCSVFWPEGRQLHFCFADFQGLSSVSRGAGWQQMSRSTQKNKSQDPKQSLREILEEWFPISVSVFRNSQMPPQNELGPSLLTPMDEIIFTKTPVLQRNPFDQDKMATPLLLLDVLFLIKLLRYFTYISSLHETHSNAAIHFKFQLRQILFTDSWLSGSVHLEYCSIALLCSGSLLERWDKLKLGILSQVLKTKRTTKRS